MSPKTACLLFAAAVSPLALHTTAAQHAPQPSHPETITLDAQGHDPAWEQSPHWRDFYALTVETLRNGPKAVDIQDYEQKSYEIFRAFARSLGADPEGMIDHLRAIPREMIAIAEADPKVLDSHENFLVALRGPR